MAKGKFRTVQVPGHDSNTRVRPGPSSIGLTEGFVATPPALAEFLAEELATLNRVPGNMAVSVLEPSAGAGDLCAAILAAHERVDLTAIEPHAGRVAECESVIRASVMPDAVQVVRGAAGGNWERGGVTLVHDTFENWVADNAPEGDGRVLFDYVIANPPFGTEMGETPNRTLWIDHVYLMWGFVKPGGRLVTVIAAGYDHRRDNRHAAMRAFVQANGGHVSALPHDIFRETRGGVGGMVLVMDKPPAEEETPERPAWIVPDYTGGTFPTLLTHPRLDHIGAMTMPVQKCQPDKWTEPQTFWYMGHCFHCQTPTWDMGGGQVPNINIQTQQLVADEYDSTGPTVARCLLCVAGTDGARLYEEALAYVETLWTSLDVIEGPGGPVDMADQLRTACDFLGWTYADAGEDTHRIAGVEMATDAAAAYLLAYEPQYRWATRLHPDRSAARRAGAERDAAGDPIGAGRIRDADRPARPVLTVLAKEVVAGVYARVTGVEPSGKRLTLTGFTSAPQGVGGGWPVSIRVSDLPGAGTPGTWLQLDPLDLVELPDMPEDVADAAVSPTASDGMGPVVSMTTVETVVKPRGGTRTVRQVVDAPAAEDVAARERGDGGVYLESVTREAPPTAEDWAGVFGQLALTL